MKILKSMLASLMFIFTFIQVSQAYALEADYKEIVINMIEQYETTDKLENEDSRFVNDRVIIQEKKKDELEGRIEKAKKKGEKFYTVNQILKASSKDFGISEEDMKKIKENIIVQKMELDNLSQAFEELGRKNHPIVKKIKNEANILLPKSEIYIDNSVEQQSQDGIISGGGWPNCLDDNGYGYQNFITSDCYKAIIGYLLCAADSTVGKMNSNLRYCKPYERNCSPLIGHKKTNHAHEWYEKIP